MIFIESMDNSFELNVIGYQFKGRNHDEYDDNWLNIRVKVDHPKGSWTATDASLLTWEVSRLIAWLESTAINANEESEIDFIEPNLRFELVKATKTKLRYISNWKAGRLGRLQMEREWMISGLSLRYFPVT